VQVLTDRTTTIRASVRDVQVELAAGHWLVVAVIFVFLRSASATLIPALRCRCRWWAPWRDVPGGLFHQQPHADGADHFHRLCGGRRHRDDREHCPLRGRGRATLQAALKGAKQIGFTIISLTISLIAVLIPLLFMGDVVGRLFREFAITWRWPS
jgi:multidrug efflux pump